ncbi:MAG: hypothetical protein NC548_24235 [Lachnospiraceae bacterium]|nr:hypothetical protein [Lachnospiraceae bacterium]
MEKKKTGIYANIAIYIYLALPTIIFLAGWLKWYLALPFALLTVYACIKGFSDSIQDKCLFMDNPADSRTFLKALLLIALWVYLSGIGGWCYQNSDHAARSAIFRALVTYNWPVISFDRSRGLIYYIGFWLPAACVGKLFGLEAGYAAQVIWAILGIFIVYYLICVYRKKVDLLPIAFLIFFSGLDYAGTWILGEEGVHLGNALHLEWWAYDVQYTSMTAQLFWVFNQAIPAWVSTALILTQKNCKNTLFILSLTMLTSTIPFVGLLPIAVYFYGKRVKTDRRLWKEVFTFQNVIGVVLIGGTVFLYLIGNLSGGVIGREKAAFAAVEPMALLLKYLLFYFLEFGVYLYFVCKYREKDSMVYLITVILLICPFIKVGYQQDFCMRASVPALFILMLLCMETLERIRLDGKKVLMAGYSVVLLVGAVTPFNEIHRSIRETFWSVVDGESVRYPEVDVENELLYGKNFSGEIEGNLFYKYLGNVKKD